MTARWSRWPSTGALGRRALHRTPGTQDSSDFAYAECGEILGLHGIRVDHPADIGAAWDEALAASRAIVLEACTDPDVPPLPPHIKAGHARAYMPALLHGDPDATSMIKRSAQQRVRQWIR